MSQRRKLQRAMLRKLGPRFAHATLIIHDRPDGYYSWAVQCTRSAKVLLGPTGKFEDEDEAWAAGWKDIRERAGVRHA